MIKKINTAIIVVILLFTACGKISKVKHLRIGHGLDPTHPVHKAMVFFADKVKEKSNGKLLISVYPSQQLGTERQCLELLQIGSLAITKVSSGVLEGFAPEFKVFSVPYLFKSNSHRFKILEGPIGKKLLVSPTPYRLRGLCYYDAGSRSFYTKDKAVNTPKDLEGLKIRTMESPMMVNMVNALGGSATPISWGELYTALQQGVVEGAENNPPSFYLSHHYEVCKYYSLDEHTSVPDVLLMSTIVWDELSDEEKKWISDAAFESYKYEKVLWKEAEQHALEEVKKAGVKVVYPDKKLFKKKVKNLVESFKTDKTLYNLIQQIQKVE